MMYSNKSAKVTKRITVSIPDLTHEKLQKWADIEGTSLADLAAYLLRKSVDLAEGDGKLEQKAVKQDDSGK